jgi:beta-galactosidase
MRAWLAGLLACSVCVPILAAPPKQDPSLRPQICLNGEWQFQPDAAKTLAFPPQGAWDKTPIRIPSPWNVNSFSRGKGGDFECFPSYPKSWEDVEAAWQRRVFTAPETMRGKRVFLRFEAVHYWADVYVNGKLAGSHLAGRVPDRAAAGVCLGCLCEAVRREHEPGA